MSQNARIGIAVAIIVVIIGAIVGVDQLQRQAATQPSAAGVPTLAPGAIPIYQGEQLLGGFNPTDLDDLEEVSFVDAEESKTQSGWLLRDVLLLVVSADDMAADTAVTVTSTSREKSVTLNWADIDNADNMVMFDVSGRGTLKLISDGLDRLATRNQWVQDVDRIDIATS